MIPLQPNRRSILQSAPRGLLILSALGLVACASAGSPAPEVAEKPAPVAAEAAAPSPAPIAATEPAAAPEPPRDPERALALVEAARAILKERGEGGALDAAGQLREALVADGRCGAAFWELGWALQLVGRWDEALDAWKQLEALEPTYPELATHLPVLLLRRDQAARLAALPDPGTLPPPELQPQGPTFTLAAVGDIHMGMAWPEHRKKLPPDDGADLFMHVSASLSAADVAFGNLETVLRDEGDSVKCGPKSTKCFAFRVPTSYAKALDDAGFDVLSIANNHAGDFGEEGRVTTMKALDAYGLHHSGPIGDIASFEVRGVRVGLIAFSTGQGVYRLQEIDAARRVVADVDRTHDLVVVSYHGGAEGSGAARVPHGSESFYGEDRGNLREFSHAVIDAGADLVLGHGPHRLRGLEIYQGRLVAYSLGNFSTWDTFSLEGPLGITAILNVTMAANGVVTEASVAPLTIVKPGRPTPDPKGQAIDILRQLSKDDFGDALLDARGQWRRQTLSTALAK